MLTRLEALSAFMTEDNLDAFLVTNDQNRRYLSGFTGSSGALLLTRDEQYLVTDFRYYQLIEKNDVQLEKLGAKILLREKIRPHVPLERAIMGVRFLLSDEHPSQEIKQFTDSPSIVLAKLGATISALISIELAIRGHLSPGGGFAAGVAGGTAIGLVAIVSSPEWMDNIYKRWNAAILEKVSVLIFFVLSALSLMGFALPMGEFGTLVSGGWITILNILVAVKVALGSWAAILIFIRYRGLL